MSRSPPTGRRGGFPSLSQATPFTARGASDPSERSVTPVGHLMARIRWTTSLTDRQRLMVCSHLGKVSLPSDGGLHAGKDSDYHGRTNSIRDRSFEINPFLRRDVPTIHKLDSGSTATKHQYVTSRSISSRMFRNGANDPACLLRDLLVVRSSTRLPRQQRALVRATLLITVGYLRLPAPTLEVNPTRQTPGLAPERRHSDSETCS